MKKENLKWDVDTFFVENYNDLEDYVFNSDLSSAEEKDIIILEDVDKNNPKNIQRVADTAAFCDSFKIGLIIHYSDGEDVVVFARNNVPRGYINIDVVFSDKRGYECELWKHPKDGIEICIYKCKGKRLDEEGLMYYNMLKSESYKPTEYI